MTTAETGREPCPDRILDDTGGAFAMGAVGGSMFQMMKGMYNSPKGYRLSGGAQAVGMNAMKHGGSFAVWGGLFSTFDCALTYARQKEDPWNSILSGAATGGLLAMRQGFTSTGRAALLGGVFLALIEGVGVVMNRHVGNEQMLMNDPAYSAQTGVPMGMGQVFGQTVPETGSGSGSESDSGSWFGGLFGKGKMKESEDNSGTKTKILESFDAPPVPTYEF